MPGQSKGPVPHNRIFYLGRIFAFASAARGSTWRQINRYIRLALAAIVQARSVPGRGRWGRVSTFNISPLGTRILAPTVLAQFQEAVRQFVEQLKAPAQINVLVKVN